MIEQITLGDGIFYTHYGEDKRYDELAKNIYRLNFFLKDFRLKRIAIFAEKSFENYCCIFATILSENTWIPMSPSTPDARNADMLRVAEPSFLFTDRALPKSMQDAADQIGCNVQRIEPLLLSPDSAAVQVPNVKEDDLAIIYFTSGSTGLPKGVKITHLNYIINVENILSLIEIQAGEVFADYHDLGFVISVPILFPCVLTGGALAPGVTLNDQILPIKNMRENAVTVLITVPSTLSRIRKALNPMDQVCELNILISCGEPMPIDILEYAFDGLGAQNIYNFYGSTEVAPWIFFHKCSYEDVQTYQDIGVVPVGGPIAGNEILFTEEQELLVAGPQVTPGYLGIAEDDRFIKLEEKRWYRTGDRLVRDGSVYICKGRLDSQVKIAGNRVELLEIEAQIRKMDEVEMGLCFVSGDANEKLIVAVLITRRKYDIADVRGYLKELLPTYMLPRIVYCLDDPPLNKSGKVDRAGIISKYASLDFAFKH